MEDPKQNFQSVAEHIFVGALVESRISVLKSKSLSPLERVELESLSNFLYNYDFEL